MKSYWKTKIYYAYFMMFFLAEIYRNAFYFLSVCKQLFSALFMLGNVLKMRIKWELSINEGSSINFVIRIFWNLCMSLSIGRQHRSYHIIYEYFLLLIFIHNAVYWKYWYHESQYIKWKRQSREQYLPDAGKPTWYDKRGSIHRRLL